MVDILNGLEPRHAGIVNVMRLVVENGQFLDLADEFPKIGLAVGRLSRRFRAEGGEEKIAPCLFFVEQLEIPAVSFLFQVFPRDESQCGRIHAVTQSSRRWTVVEQMTQMRISGFRTHFGPPHEQLEI